MSNNRILYSLKTSMACPLLSLNYWACSGEEEVGGAAQLPTHCEAHPTSVIALCNTKWRRGGGEWARGNDSCVWLTGMPVLWTLLKL